MKNYYIMLWNIWEKKKLHSLLVKRIIAEIFTFFLLSVFVRHMGMILYLVHL